VPVGVLSSALFTIYSNILLPPQTHSFVPLGSGYTPFTLWSSSH